MHYAAIRMSVAKVENKLCLAKHNPEPVFDLSECDIKRVPKKIFSVIKVLRKELLYLQNNNLTSLKDGGDLRDLYLLKLLDLRSNKISELPPDIQYLKYLQVLRIDDNELTSLPVEIGKLINLEQLTISSNRLKSLPNTLSDLKNLRHLDLRSNNQLCSLPFVTFKNKRLEILLLDDDRDWIEPPTHIVRNGTRAIISYFVQKNGLAETENDETVMMEESCSKKLQQLSIYDEFIQDNLRRLEKEKEEKLYQKIKMEKKIVDQTEKELLLRQKNQKDRQKLMDDLAEQQRRIDHEIEKCQKRKEMERCRFIRQHQTVEVTADEVIRQLLKTNTAQKKKQISSVISSLYEDISTKNTLHQQTILESMEKILAEEYRLSQKLKEKDITRQNLVHLSNLNDQELENKIFSLLSERRNEQCALIDRIQKDTNLQYVAVLMLIQKSDYRNVELQNQISIVQNQLSNLTAIELQNRNLYVDKHVNELAERRIALTNLLQDIFSQQQNRQKQLVDQLREVEKFQSSVFQGKSDYWLIQFQRLLESNHYNLFDAIRRINSAFLCELALFGVSHYAVPLSIFDLNSLETLSEINDEDLEKVGIKNFEDRCSILNAIQHFINDQRGESPSDPVLNLSDEISTTSSVCDTHDSSLNPDGFPCEPDIQNTVNVKLTNTLNEILPNECVICLEKQSNIVFLPCGHLCCCGSCFIRVNRCPLCRCDIESKMKVYI